MAAKEKVYFLYSEEYFREMNSVLNPKGKSFVAGTVVVNGLRKKFTNISTTKSLPRFIDTKVVAEGVQSQYTYTSPSVQNNKNKGV